MSTPRHLEFRTSRGMRYHLLNQPGPTTQPTWFFLHGFLGQSEDWLPFIQHLPPNTPWYALDLLGHGKSDRPEEMRLYTAQNLYADITEIIQHFQHTANDVVVGYSMGGRQLLGACAWANLQPGALILMGSHFGLRTIQERAARQATDTHWYNLMLKSLEQFLEAWYQQPLLSRQPPKDPEERAAWYRRRLNNSPVALARCLNEFSPSKTPDFSTNPPQFAFPVLLLAGEHDPSYIKHYQEIVESLPTASTIVIPDSGHTLPLESPQATCQQCLKFLNSLPR